MQPCTRQYGTVQLPPPPYSEARTRSSSSLSTAPANIPPNDGAPALKTKQILLKWLAASGFIILVVLSPWLIFGKLPLSSCPAADSVVLLPPPMCPTAEAAPVVRLPPPSCPTAEPCPRLDPATDVPWPGNTYLIRDRGSKRFVTLKDGIVSLMVEGDRGGQLWECQDGGAHEGWIGFRNSVSGRFLGHDNDWNLRVENDRLDWWEEFAVRQYPDGGYVLYLRHGDGLWHIGLNGDRLAKVDGDSPRLQWDFVKP